MSVGKDPLSGFIPAALKWGWGKDLALGAHPGYCGHTLDHTAHPQSLHFKVEDLCLLKIKTVWRLLGLPLYTGSFVSCRALYQESKESFGIPCTNELRCCLINHCDQKLSRAGGQWFGDEPL